MQSTPAEHEEELSLQKRIKRMQGNSRVLNTMWRKYLKDKGQQASKGKQKPPSLTPLRLEELETQKVTVDLHTLFESLQPMIMMRIPFLLQEERMRGGGEEERRKGG